MFPDHQHMHVMAVGLRKVPTDPDVLGPWLTELVAKVDMNVLFGPFSLRCDATGNEGITGFIGLYESHAAIHVWERPVQPYLAFDVYSCKSFSPTLVLDHLRVFEPEKIHWTLMDRNGPLRGEPMKLAAHGVVSMPDSIFSTAEVSA